MTAAHDRRNDETQRLEAVRRLAVPDGADDHGLTGLVDLLRLALRADAAALTVIDARRTWPLAAAGASTALPCERRVASAAGVVDGQDAVTWTVGEALLRSPDGHPWAHAGSAVAAVAAAPVRAPDGEVIGAIEVAWGDAQAPDAGRAELLLAGAQQVASRLLLRAEAAEHRRFVELAPDALVVLDVDGTIELCNGTFADLVGAPGPAALQGSGFLGLVAADDRLRVAEEVASVLFVRRGDGSIEFGLVRRDGTQIPVDASVAHLRGARRSLQLVVRDLTVQLQAATDRARLTERLASAHRFETVGQLAGGLAHDLNNLLTVLVSNLSLADETVRDLATGGDVAGGIDILREDLGHLRAASDRVGSLTRQLLQFASHGGETAVRVEPAEVLRPLRELLARTLGPDHPLELELGDGLPVVEVDVGGLEQAVTNLVLNARDALADGGTIHVEARRADPGDRGAGGGEAVAISVRDAGPGMTDDVLARAFEPLFSTKSADRGTGLGLATVQAFAQRAGGAVDLSSAPGAGTCVSLVLPAADAPTVQAPAAAPRVLLVDPAEASRHVIAAMLTQSGYRVREVADVHAAERQLEAGDVDVLACELAVVAGATSRIARLAAAGPATVPVVLLSSTPDVRDEVDGYPLLAKPFSSERLRQTVTAVRVATADRRA